MPMLPRPLPVLCINLDADRQRMEATERLFGSRGDLELRRVPGIDAAAFPLAAVRALTRSAIVQRGALGCFLAHVAAWERVAAAADWMLVIEDDCRPGALASLPRLAIPKDAEFIWVNSGGSPRLPPPDPGQPALWPVRRLVASKARLPPHLGAEPGAQGYLVSPEGARKLLDAVAEDGFFGHVDWRLLRYALSREDLLAEAGGTRLLQIPMLSIERDLGLRREVVRAYCLSPPLILPREGERSIRRERDRPGGGSA